ncbi:MAG: membrane protein insertase YidC [Parcubacteria group bacterium]|nr:membrane protein insertase YidC [Parcubacteria group bacterium]
MNGFFTEIFFRPILNLLAALYNLIPGHDLGVAIILVTLVVRFLLAPFTRRSLTTQLEMQKIQPELAGIRKQYAHDREAQARAMMEVYRTRKVSPFGSLTPLFIQLPVLIALFQVLSADLASIEPRFFYSFVTPPHNIDPTLGGFLALNEPSIILGVLAGVAQFFQSRMLVIANQPEVKADDTAAMVSRQSMYLIPLVVGITGARFPAGISLYWTVSTLFGLVQQWLILKPRTATKTQVTASPPLSPPHP